MTTFSVDWLSLREPADHRARSAALTREVAETLGDPGPVGVLDLASGTGSNVRYLTDRILAEQEWLLVDHDPLLLSAVNRHCAAWGRDRGYHAEDLAGSLRMSGQGWACRLSTRRSDVTALDAALFRGRVLVTASAFLDLVSESWLHSLIAECRRNAATVLLALTYDGRMKLSPEEPEDGDVCGLVNRHQLTDKGFGEALGPHAASRAEDLLAREGYEVRREPSDWRLTPADAELQRQLIEGWAFAAGEIAPEQVVRIDSWRVRRLAHVAAERAHMTVGHVDIAASLAQGRSAAGTK
jgi:hypothetical protein